VGEKSLVAWSQPIGFMQMFGRERSMVIRVALRETFHDGRNCNGCDSETQENTHISKVGRRKRKESAIFD